MGREKASGAWAAPYVGAELELRWASRDRLSFIEQVQIAGGIGIGPALGGDGGSLTHLHADLTIMFTPNFGAYMGYKLVDVHVKNHEYELDGGLEGLVFGATLRF